MAKAWDGIRNIENGIYFQVNEWVGLFLNINKLIENLKFALLNTFPFSTKKNINITTEWKK